MLLATNSLSLRPNARLSACLTAMFFLLLNISPVLAQVPAEGDLQRRPRVGLALGGGGMRGAAHVGVLKVLERESIPIDCIAGTSMGAVVGGLYSAGVSVEELEHKFSDGSLMKAFMTVPISVRVAASPLFFFGRMVGAKPFDGMYRGGIFREYLLHSLPKSSEPNIEKLRIPFSAVALNLVDGKAYSLTKGNLGVALQASSAVPMLRRPVPIDDKLFVDGGVVANLPVKQARELGADVVIAVDVDETFDPMPPDSFRRMGSVAHRVLTLHLTKVDEEQLADANVLIHPSVNGISLVSTKTKDAKAAISAGERAAEAVVPLIKKLIESRDLTVHNQE
ncbi:MAG TPA: patatin-like phospholipase family protein [Candidatus Obscuribacterales bacterium]